MRSWLSILTCGVMACAHGPPNFAEHSQTDETLAVVRRAFLYAVREPSFARARLSDCRMHLESYNAAIREVGGGWRARFKLDPYCSAQLPPMLDFKSDFEVDIQNVSHRLIAVRMLSD